MGMRRNYRSLAGRPSHRHSQPTSASKATTSTTNMSSATIMVGLLCSLPPTHQVVPPLGLVSEFRKSLSLSVQLRGITLEITGSCQGPVA
jgi:hypothetical protein